MPGKKLLWPLVIIVVVFVTLGDSFKFLPPAVRSASTQSRSFVVGLWPKWLRPRDTNEEREKEIEQLDKPSPKSSS